MFVIMTADEWQGRLTEHNQLVASIETMAKTLDGLKTMNEAQKTTIIGFQSQIKDKETEIEVGKKNVQCLEQSIRRYEGTFKDGSEHNHRLLEAKGRLEEQVRTLTEKMGTHVSKIGQMIISFEKAVSDNVPVDPKYIVDILKELVYK